MNFRELENLLINAGVGCRAAECHGFLCGYICVAGHMEEEIFRQYLFADTMDIDRPPELLEGVSTTAREIQSGLGSENFTLELLLPDDNVSLSERSEALIQWCESFLSGLGIGGLTELDLLSTESREVIQDILNISLMDLDTITGNSDEEEQAYIELTEYVRMGAMLLHEELQPSTDHNNRPEVLH